MLKDRPLGLRLERIAHAVAHGGSARELIEAWVDVYEYWHAESTCRIRADQPGYPEMSEFFTSQGY